MLLPEPMKPVMTIRAFHFPFHLFSFFIDFSVLGHSNVEHALIESRLQVRLLQSECEYVAPKLSFGEKTRCSAVWETNEP
ncbi:MAG: hypothetical protein M3R15_19015, partial [Acidobacteriota bacterium]|nr:hypothetical protein [Acidobacteriota bacterium]